MVKNKNQIILEMLKENARITLKEIAQKLKISETAVRKRIKKLERDGVIKKYTIEIDHQKLGYEIKALIGIDTLPESYVHVIDILKKDEKINNICASTGDHMIMLEVWFHNNNALTNYVKWLEKLPGVTKVCPAILLGKLK